MPKTSNVKLHSIKSWKLHLFHTSPNGKWGEKAYSLFCRYTKICPKLVIQYSNWTSYIKHQNYEFTVVYFLLFVLYFLPLYVYMYKSEEYGTDAKSPQTKLWTIFCCHVKSSTWYIFAYSCTSSSPYLTL